jgi:hypothetical protein
MKFFGEITIGFLCASALLGILLAMDIGGAYFNGTMDEVR